MIDLLIENGGCRVVLEADDEGLMGLDAAITNAHADGEDTIVLASGHKVIIRKTTKEDTTT